jgi:hypothetical protein
MRKVFLLSPANTGGKRAQMLLNPAATFELAVRLRSEGLSIAESFSFLSGLYFRGKAAYARHFAAQQENILVITAGRGLLPLDTLLTPADFAAFREVPIDLAEPRYREPLVRDAQSLAEQLTSNGRAVLLGSVATMKYVEPLLSAFSERLVFPRDFIGRGDMSRGGLMLRAVDACVELPCIRVEGAVRHGKRPAKLEPRPRRTDCC